MKSWGRQRLRLSIKSLNLLISMPRLMAMSVETDFHMELIIT